jgi:hypothetical protein
MNLQPKTTEDLHTPPASQWASSIFKMALASPILGVFIVIAAYWLCDTILPPGESTEQLKQMIAGGIIGGSFISSAGGAIGLVQRSLKLTDAKIKMQTPAELPDSIQAGVVNMDTVSTPPVSSEQPAFLPSEYSEFTPGEEEEIAAPSA